MTNQGNQLSDSETGFYDSEQVDAVFRGSKLELNDSVAETYRAFLEALPEGSVTLSQEGIVLHCNPKFLHMLEASSSDVIGLPFQIWFSLEEGNRFNHILANQNSSVSDYLLNCSSGTLLPVQISANWLRVSELDLVFMVVFDLSTLRQLELERHKFFSLAENSFDLIVITDQHLEVVYINPHGLNMIGIESLQANNKTSLQALFFEDDQAFIHVDRLTDECTINVELRLKHGHSGRPVWVSVNTFKVHDTQNIHNGYACIMRDITERKRIEDQLRLTWKVFEHSLESVVITNTHCEIIDVNNAFSRITGYDHDEVLGLNPRFLQSGKHSPAFYAEMWHSIDERGHWSGEICNKGKSGEFIYEWISISSVKNETGQIEHYISLASDISVYKAQQHQLEHLAHFDSLTGIPNRVLLSDRLNQAIAQSQREEKLLAVCYLDLDGFKPINDEMGHDAGDYLLITVTKRIQQSIRSSDTVARIGGDEFVILLLGLEKQEECIFSVQRLLDNIAKPVAIQDRTYLVTASIGITLFPYDNVNPDCLLRHADQSMYAAKQMGKNRYCFYDLEQEQQAKSRLENKQRLQKAFINHEFILHFQPKVELRSLRPIGVEALIRWQHPEQGLLSPGQFMDVIETSELEIELGEFVIEQSLRQIHAWQTDGLNTSVSINIAAKHLQAGQFITHLHSSLKRYPELPAGTLEIEILESAALNDMSTVFNVIENCKAIGVGFALDDFGTGYSTLIYLRELPADTLKIDQTFVRDMLIDHGDHAIVKGIIALSKAFNRLTVAEGVESMEHISLLNNLGCEYGQGYAIAKPMPAEQLPAWFANWQTKQVERI